MGRARGGGDATEVPVVLDHIAAVLSYHLPYIAVYRVIVVLIIDDNSIRAHGVNPDLPQATVSQQSRLLITSV